MLAEDSPLMLILAFEYIFLTKEIYFLQNQMLSFYFLLVIYFIISTFWNTSSSTQSFKPAITFWGSVKKGEI